MPSQARYHPIQDLEIDSSIVDEYEAKSARIRLKACLAKCHAVLAAVVVTLLAALLVGKNWSSQNKQHNGQSPPWYPSPRGGVLLSWKSSYDEAHVMVEQMTIVEKVNVTTGTGWAMNLCVGNTGSVIRVGFPPLCLQDGPLGIRFSDNITSFPAGITVGSTWNRDLMRRRGAAHGREAKVKGINVLLGPSMGPLGRNPAGGRGWEGFGADPVLQAVAAYETIMGIQSQGVMATAKHLVGNEQEHFRKPFEWGLTEALSSNIDDRSMHEIYAWPFAESIRAGVVSIMCSYQMLNNSYACQNSKLLNGILKDEMGFQGFVQSDWLAQRSGVASALAGLDMSMPGDGIHWQDGKALYGDQLTIAVLNGSIPSERLNDMALRIVAAWYQVGQNHWENDGPNFSSWTGNKIGKWHDAAKNSHDEGVVNKFIDASNEESRSVAREVAAEGIVLLKNNGILPLNPNLSSLVIGRKPCVMILGEDSGPGQGPNMCPDRSCNQGTLAVGWGSGATEFTYLIDPLSALHNAFEAVDMSSSASQNVDTEIIRKLGKQDLCLAFGNAIGGEGYLRWENVYGDRPDLDLQKNGTQLIKSVAENCGGPVIVIIHAIGPVIMEEFADLTNVAAILFANLPGQESGNALADVLFGRSDASGRLAFTIGKSLDDYGDGAKVLYTPNALVPQVDFTEGLYIDYRHFDRYEIDPRYPFGHGLSYTTFELSEMVIETMKPKTELPDPRPNTLIPPEMPNSSSDPTAALFPKNFYKLEKYIYPYISSITDVKNGTYPYPTGYNIKQTPSQAGGGPGGNPSLFETQIKVRVKVKNIGTRLGKDVLQLYVSYPGKILDSDGTGRKQEIIDTPVRVLRNFDKILLSPGEESTVEMNLTRKDLSYWSVLRQNWIMPTQGEFVISVGHSSRDLILDAKY